MPPSNDHSNTLPVSPNTSIVAEPFVSPTQVGDTMLDAMGIPTVPD
jgi:hypothetical protein